ncbi:unnamed protein product [Phytophthora fragariaefolia]|uniref:Unnamed protein product n=1 Tax=Phytophthora fragariaefolia TaxID=1490495 RepID=A0A9W6Y6C0_9STRA|nr:unnamed protein product [Phytophthora fragariaefolia]
MGTVGLKPMDGTSATRSDVLYIPKVEGSLILVAKLIEKDVIAQFSKDKCAIRYGGATIMEAKRCGNVYKLKRDEQLLTMADGVPLLADALSGQVCTGCCMCKMREDNFPRNPEITVKSMLMSSTSFTQTSWAQCRRRHQMAVHTLSRSLTISHVTSQCRRKQESWRNSRCSRLTSKTQQGAKSSASARPLAESTRVDSSRSTYLSKMARYMLYHEGIDKTWWVEPVNTSAWIVNRIPNTVTVKTPYEIVYQKKPQLKNMTVFGALGYGHIPDDMRLKLDAKAFKCRFFGLRGWCRQRWREDVTAPHATAPNHGQSHTITIINDEMVPLQREMGTETAIVPAPSHSMITRSRARNIEETTEHEEAEGRKKQSVATIGTKRQKVSQRRVSTSNELLAIEGSQLMAAIQEVPKTYTEATTRQDQDEWKIAIASELKSLIVKKTWKLVPKPAYQRPIGCRWVFALKRDEKGQVVWRKARLVAMAYHDDMLIATRQKTVIAPVKAGIVEKFIIKDLGKAHFVLGIEIDYDIERGWPRKLETMPNTTATWCVFD